ncbi:hypothetical protein CGK40_22915, partial [Vibrio parahaemolyticus]
SNFYRKYDDEGAVLGLWSARGWPISNAYWSSTVAGSYYFIVHLRSASGGPTFNGYASCVSKNP